MTTWIDRNKSILEVSQAAMSYGTGPLTGHENSQYHIFVQSAVDLVDEEHPPDYLPVDRDKARKHIEHILTQNIQAYRLRRLFPMIAPETALLAADTIARMGTDRMYWKKEEME